MSKGYDNLDINHNMVLDLPFSEGLGAVALDVSKSRYAFTLTGAPAYAALASGIPVLDFTLATPDFLEAAIANVPNLDFTTEDFSYAGWLNPDVLGPADYMVFCHGLAATEGFYLMILANGFVDFESNQAGVAQQVISSTGDVVINTNTLVGFSRSGVLGQIFVNGREVAYTVQDDLINPLTSARKFLFGVYDDETGTPWTQYMGRQRFWLNRQLSVDDHRYIFETERHWYGV